MKKKNVIGIVLRYADTHFGEDVDTIEAHNEVLKKKGKVYVGKAGKVIADKFLAAADDSEVETRLLLATRRGGSYEIYTARTTGATRRQVQDDLVPSYYRNSRFISCWFLLEEPLKKMSRTEMNQWVIRSSGNPLLESLYLSMSGFFIAILSKGRPVRNVDETKLQKKGKKRRSMVKTFDDPDDRFILDDDVGYF